MKKLSAIPRPKEIYSMLATGAMLEMEGLRLKRLTVCPRFDEAVEILKSHLPYLQKHAKVKGSDRFYYNFFSDNPIVESLNERYGESQSKKMTEYAAHLRDKLIHVLYICNEIRKKSEKAPLESIVEARDFFGEVSLRAGFGIVKKYLVAA